MTTTTDEWVTLKKAVRSPRTSRYGATLYIQARETPLLRIQRQWVDKLGDPPRVLVEVNRTQQTIRLIASVDSRGRKVTKNSVNGNVTSISAGGFAEALGLDKGKIPARVYYRVTLLDDETLLLEPRS